MAKSEHGKQGRYIDRFDVLLLDMGNTFMFGCDRFGLEDGLGRTYAEFGGKLLESSQVHRILSTVFQMMTAYGKVEANYESIKSVSHYIEKLQDTVSLPRNEMSILEKVFTEHEIGVIPDEYADILRELGKTHRLGLISDIWARSDRFYRELEETGIKSLFDVIVFSSDIGIIKPSGKIFAKAMEGFDVDVSKVVYIGDSFRRDVTGARNFGMSAVWIRHGQVLEECNIRPDLIINDLRDLYPLG